jgi:TolB-like protein/Tfp pilus assembly protein PilF
MLGSMSRFRRLILELHRRSLWQVLLVYAGASWAVLQAVDHLVQRLALPMLVYGLAVTLLLVGLPVVLATAFVQEAPAPDRSSAATTAEGRGSGGDGVVAPEAGSGGDAGGGPPRSTPPERLARVLTWRNAIGGGVIAFGVAAGAVTVLIAAGVIGRTGTTGDGEAIPTIAVLPLDALSSGGADDFLTDGIHDEIIARLAKISGLRVTSRTSVLPYKGERRNLREIAGELGVRYVLEGSVRRAGTTARVTAQLIDARHDHHLWTDTYDSDLGDVSSILAVQTAVAERIAASLGAELTGSERRLLAHQPTSSPEAYEFYLGGREFASRNPTEHNLTIALRMLGSAVEADPGYALAWAMLGREHARLHWFHYDRSQERVDMARRSIDRALALEPDLPEAHLALGAYHYWIHLDYARAASALELAARAIPGDAEVWAFMGYVRRRQGRWGEALEHLARAIELNPRSAELARHLAETYGVLRDYRNAVAYYERAGRIAPDEPFVQHASLHLYALGDTAAARQLASSVSPQRGVGGVTAPLLPVLFDLERYRRSTRARQVVEEDTVGMIENQFFVIPRWHLLAEAYTLEGDTARARVYYDSARVALEARLRQDPQDSRLHSALALALAGLGDGDAAVRSAVLATELLPVEREAWRGARRRMDLARVLAMTGRHDEAMDEIEFLLSVPSDLHPPMLRLDPVWDPLRDHPRFQAVLARPAFAMRRG